MKFKWIGLCMRIAPLWMLFATACSSSPGAGNYKNLVDTSAEELPGFGHAGGNWVHVWMAPLPHHPAGKNNVNDQKTWQEKEEKRCVHLMRC